MARVLVIDDDLMVSGLLKEHLTNEGYTVETASMAKDGFDMALKTPPDLIFLDVMLPDATGFQMVGRFKDHPQTKAIPIILMTGAARSPNQQAMGKNMGADDYILKPFNVLEVGERVHQLIGSKLQSTPPAPTENTVPVETPKEAEQEVKPVETGPKEIDIHMKPAVSQTPLPVPPPMVEESDVPITDFLDSINSVSSNLPADSTTEIKQDNPAPEPSQPEMPSYVEPRKTSMPVRAAVSPRVTTVTGRPSVVSYSCSFAYLMFVAHLALSAAAVAVASDPASILAHAVMFTAVGWTLMIALLVAMAFILRMGLEVRAMVWILGWTSVPIVLRALGSLLSNWIPALIPLRSINPTQLRSAVYWFRPLDLFEMTAVLILGLLLRRQQGSSITKSILTVLVVMAAWCAATRGYLLLF